jgi:hypothetical protein
MSQEARNLYPAQSIFLRFLKISQALSNQRNRNRNRNDKKAQEMTMLSIQGFHQSRGFCVVWSPAKLKFGLLVEG